MAASSLLLLGGCAGTDTTGRPDSSALAGFVDRAAGAASAGAEKIRRKIASTDALKGFHDAAEHSEDKVLALLRGAGIGRNTRTRSVKPASKVPELPATGSSIPDGALRWPIEVGVISSEFGHRWGRQHRGIDIAGEIGTPIVAAADGDVIYAGSGLSGYGNVVILRHANEGSTLYAHNSELKVRTGQQVRQGEPVALLGNSGRSTGPHLHFEIRSGEIAIDPRTVLPPSRLAGELVYPVAAARVER